MPSRYIINGVHLPAHITEKLSNFRKLDQLRFDIESLTEGNKRIYADQISLAELQDKLRNDAFALRINLGKSTEEFVKAPAEIIAKYMAECRSLRKTLLDTLGWETTIYNKNLRELEICGSPFAEFELYFLNILNRTSAIPYVRIGGYLKLPIKPEHYANKLLRDLSPAADITCVDFGVVNLSNVFFISQLSHSLPGQVQDVRLAIEPSITCTTITTDANDLNALNFSLSHLHAALANKNLSSVTISILNRKQVIDVSTHDFIVQILGNLPSNIKTVNLDIERKETMEPNLVLDYVYAINPSVTLRFSGWQYGIYASSISYVSNDLHDALYGEFMSHQAGMEMMRVKDFSSLKATIANVYARLCATNDAHNISLFRAMLWDAFNQFNIEYLNFAAIERYSSAAEATAFNTMTGKIKNILETICLHLVLLESATPTGEHAIWKSYISTETLAAAIANRQRVRAAAQSMLQHAPAPAAVLTDVVGSQTAAQGVSKMLGWLKDNAASTYTFTRDTKYIIGKVNRELALLVTLAAGGFVISRAPAVARIADAGKARL